MGAWGALIMSFFGGLFAALTLHWQWELGGPALALPFIVFAVIALSAAYVIRQPGKGLVPSEKAERAILWSSIGEGIGLFLAVNIAVNSDHPEWRLPAMALVVGIHFLPIALAASFPPFYGLAAALMLSAIVGFMTDAPLGGEIAGGMAAISLWGAAVLAVARDWRAKKAS